MRKMGEGAFGISIHALVKRATVLRCSETNRNIISIHALVKRATVMHFRKKPIFGHFNPRPREEGDKSSGYYTTNHNPFQSTPS